MNALIAYSSGLGSTREVAEEIAKILDESESIDVDLKTVDEVGEIGKYDAVIIGSSVRADRPMANVRDFFARFRHVLPKKKIALFAVCLSANCESGKEKVKSEYLSQITEKYPELNPVSLGAFGGKIDFNQLNPVMQKLMERVLDKTGIPQKGSVDTRDWEYIHAWANELIEKLNA